MSWWSVAALVFSLIAAIYFYGVGFNLLFLWVVILVLAVVYIARGPNHVSLSFSRQPVLVLICYLTLVLIALHHNLFSISFDSSFAPSLIAISLPLVVLVTRPQDARKTHAVAAWLVFVYATMSAVEFLVEGRRAHTPLFDPNNYVTLLYLAWIPWILDRCAMSFRLPRIALSSGVSLVVCIAMLATTSRFALLVIAGMTLLVLFLAWGMSWDWRNVTGLLTAVALAFILVSVFDPSGLNEAFDAPSAQSTDSAESTRMLMAQAASRAMVEYGGMNGTGLFTFSLLYPQVRSTLEQVTTAQFVHNDYLQLALEGGIWLLVPLVVLLFALLRQGWIGLIREQTYAPWLGYAIALGVACIHALVNFVFYVLPLMVMMGLVLACAFRMSSSEPREVSNLGMRKIVGGGIWSVTSMGLLYCTFLLANDALTYGVFSAQDHVPFAADIRREPQRMLAFAQTSQKINHNRGVPILGEARLREVALAQQPSDVSPEQLREIATIYRRAIEVDPWNPSGYTNFYTFQERFGQADPTAQAALLARARRLDPLDLTAIALTIDRAVLTGNFEQAHQVVAEMMVWCEFLARRRGAGFMKLLQRLQSARLMTQAGPELNAQLAGCMAHPAFNDRDGREPTAVMRWLRGDAKVNR